MIISSDMESGRRNTVKGNNLLFNGIVVYKPAKGKKFPPEAKITHVSFGRKIEKSRYCHNVQRHFKVHVQKSDDGISFSKPFTTELLGWAGKKGEILRGIVNRIITLCVSTRKKKSLSLSAWELSLTTCTNLLRNSCTIILYKKDTNQ